MSSSSGVSNAITLAWPDWPAGTSSCRPCSRSSANRRAARCFEESRPRRKPIRPTSSDWPSKAYLTFCRTARDSSARRLFFAAKRFRRWLRINPNATLRAQAATLHELHETYGLSQLESIYPETRVRALRETVFRDAGRNLADALEDIIQRLRMRQILPADISGIVTDLRARLNLTPAENFFLTRLSYPYLRPEDEAELVASAPGGVRQSDMVVTMMDADGNTFQIRHAVSPREIGRLHRMFLAAKLAVEFRAEHRFLVAVNERGVLMGGLFYELQPEARTAHMDKVVVSERYQRKGVAAALLEELFKRLKTSGFQSLTTGFFRPAVLLPLRLRHRGKLRRPCAIACRRGIRDNLTCSETGRPVYNSGFQR